MALSENVGHGLSACLGAGEIVTFTVRDFASARAFYVGRLGLPIVEERPGHFVMVKAGTTRLCIDAEDDEKPARGGGAALILFSTNLAAVEMALRVQQVEYRRGTGPEHGDYLLIADPEGYTLSISKA